MKTFSRLLLLAFIFIFSCAQNKKQVPGNIDPEYLLINNIGEFSRVDTVRVFDKDNLWKYIDGAADKLVELGFEKLAVADYSHDSLEVTAEIYAFISSDGANQVYSDNKTAHERIIKIGDEGFITPGLLFIHKRNLHIQVSCYNLEAGDSPLLQFGRDLDKIIEKTQGSK
jgi:hypothetical protein